LGSLHDTPARVFLVEDSSDDEYFIRRAMLRLFPHLEISVASSGRDAIATLTDESYPLPDLVLVDIRPPDVNGHEVVGALRSNERFKTVPIVMLTSSDERADIELAYELGANGYVQKPDHFDEYVERFEALLQYWLGINTS
jgi:DNA-binding response OmpR family regulator